jgi:hypothetical protein
MEYVEVRLRLPRFIVDWLENIAKCRGETVDDVVAWTLGSLYNYYQRWVVVPKVLGCNDKPRKNKP